MPLIYITGIAGSGKSSVRKELLRRGYEAHGTDEDGIAAFYYNETGEIVDSPVDAPPRTREWHEHHTWKISRQAVEALAERAKHKGIFLCGTASDDSVVWNLFSQVFALTLNEATLKHRLAFRTNNSFGKAAHELESMLEWQKNATDDYEKFGVIIIDATQSLATVVDEILDKVINFSQVGQDSLKAYVRTIKHLIEKNEHFDAIVAAGDSGQLTARITEEVYKALGKPVPLTLTAPIYRHADEAETILFDNTSLAPQFVSWKNKPLDNILFVDDEIGVGNAVRGMLDLLLELAPNIQALTIVAEDGGFDCPVEIRGVKTTFISTQKRIPHVFNAISYSVPWEFKEPLNKVLADEPGLNDKQIMCTLLGLPTKEFHDGHPEFNERLIERAEARLPELKDMQQRYEKYFQNQIGEYVKMDSKTTLTAPEGILQITHVETQTVKEGVLADLYTFDNDTTKDLAVVHVAKGHKTPLQRILKGAKTIEGYMSGVGSLTVTTQDGSQKRYAFAENTDSNPSVETEVHIGELMQWSADTDLTFYEICEPPYEDGRFEDLA